MRENSLDWLDTIVVLLALMALVAVFSWASLWPWLQYVVPSGFGRHRKSESTTEHTVPQSIASRSVVESESTKVVPIAPDLLEHDHRDRVG
jgi:hypothetical protein